MTPVDFLTHAQTLRPELVCIAGAITKDQGLAEDAVQEALYFSYKKVHLYDEKQASLATWLTGLVIQKARTHKSRVDHLYGDALATEFSDLVPYDPTDPSMKEVHDAGLPQVRIQPHVTRRAMRRDKTEPDPEAHYTPTYDRDIDIRAAVLALPKDQREAARAVFMGGMTQAKYAREIGVSRNTVARRCALAKAALRKKLK